MAEAARLEAELERVDEGEQEGGEAAAQGSQRPNTTSAMQTQPRPETTPKVKELNCAMQR